MNTNQTSTPAPATPDRPAIQHLWTTTDVTGPRSPKGGR